MASSVGPRTAKGAGKKTPDLRSKAPVESGPSPSTNDQLQAVIARLDRIERRVTENHEMLSNILQSSLRTQTMPSANPLDYYRK